MLFLFFSLDQLIKFFAREDLEISDFTNLTIEVQNESLS